MALARILYAIGAFFLDLFTAHAREDGAAEQRDRDLREAERQEEIARRAGERAAVNDDDSRDLRD